MSITDEELRSNIQTLLSAAAGKARVLAAAGTFMPEYDSATISTGWARV